MIEIKEFTRKNGKTSKAIVFPGKYFPCRISFAKAKLILDNADEIKSLLAKQESL